MLPYFAAKTRKIIFSVYFRIIRKGWEIGVVEGIRGMRKIIISLKEI